MKIYLTVLITMLAAIALPMHTNAQSPSRENEVTEVTIKKGLGCLVLQDWIKDDLRELGLSVGALALVNYGRGAIPGMSPEQPNNVNIMIRTPRSTHGWMLFFRLERNGNVTAINNAYRLTRTGQEWSASEGNGGIATYKAVGAYATELMQRRARMIRLQPRKAGCGAE